MTLYAIRHDKTNQRMKGRRIDALLGRRPWLVLATLVFHITEEWPLFPEWATSHFGTTSPRFFAVSHVPIVALVAWISFNATRSSARNGSIWCLAMVLAALGTNGLFHLAATFHFGEYSPGVVTSIAFYFPLFIYLFPMMIAILGRRQVVTANLSGILLSVVITFSLAIDMPVL